MAEPTNQQTQAPEAYDVIRKIAEGLASSIFHKTVQNPESGEDVRIFIETGHDLSENLRKLIAQIPDLDANDGDWRFDSLVNDLLTEPEDLSNSDLKNLQRLTGEFIAGAQTPEHKEIAAQLYFQQQFGSNYAVPQGETALGNLDIYNLKKSLRSMTADIPENSETTVMGVDIDPYIIEHASVSDAMEPEFLSTFSQSIERLQRDMREMGAAPPVGDHAFLKPVDALDDGRILRTAEKAMAPLGNNDELTAIRAIPSPAARLDGYAAYIEALNTTDDVKAGYMNAINTLRPDQPVLDQLELATELELMSEYEFARFVLSDVQLIGEERTGTLSENTSRYLNAYLDYMTHDNNYGSPAMRSRAQAYAGFMDQYNALPQDQRDKIEDKLEHDSTEPLGIQTTPSRADQRILTEEAKAQLTAEQQSALDALANMGQSGNVPASIIQTITDPQRLNGQQYAFLDEAFQQSTDSILQDNMARLFGSPDPNNVGTRIGGDALLRKAWFDAEQNPYEFVEQPDGNYTLHSVDAKGNIDPNPVPADAVIKLYQYGINSDGSISRHLLGPDGSLHEFEFNGSPVKLEGDQADFDTNHVHYVTTRFLEKVGQAQWTDLRISAGLQDMPSTLPTVSALDEKAESIQTSLNEQIKLYYDAQGQDMSNQAIETLVADLKSSPMTQDSFRQKLGAQNDAQTQASDAILNLLIQLDAMDTIRENVVAIDYSRYMDTGNLPAGLTLSNPPQAQIEWHVDWDKQFVAGELQWRDIELGRTFPPEAINAYYDTLNNKGKVDTALFSNNQYAASYIDEQGWSGGQLDYIQASMLGRAMMLKESADRHGITDPNSVEAKQAFIEDFREGHYHWHDVEMFMRSFDSDQQRLNARLEAEGKLAIAPNAFDFGASVGHRSEMFNEIFGTDVELTDAEGNVLAIAENSTISRDDAVELFWQSQGHRKEFGYSESRYDLGYDEMVAEHGEDFTSHIKDIMEHRSLYQQFMVMDSNNPEGDQKAIYERKFMGHVEDSLEENIKRNYEVVSAAALSPITSATLDPDMDVVIEDPAASSAEPDVQPQSTPQPEQQGYIDPSLMAPPAAGMPMRRTG